VRRHIDVATAAAAHGEGRRPAFTSGSAEQIPVPSASADLVWCSDVLVHVADLAGAYGEFRRILRPGGRALVYQIFATALLEPHEAAWLFGTMGVWPASAEPGQTEAAIATARLRIDERIDIGCEWGE